MSFGGFKKNINKANQYLSEKIAKKKGTEMEQDFVQCDKKIDAYKTLFESLLNRSSELLYPNPTLRAKLNTKDALSNIGKASVNTQKTRYPHVEGHLADNFQRFLAEHTDESSFAKSLQDSTRIFTQINEIRGGLEDQMKESFNVPVQDLISMDLREISQHKKKLESRRLDYDGKRRNREKTKDEDLRVAEAKFIESKETTFSAMSNFLDDEAAHVNLLAQFVKVQMEFHERAHSELQHLLDNLNKYKREADEKPRTKRSVRPISEFSGSEHELHFGSTAGDEWGSATSAGGGGGHLSKSGSGTSSTFQSFNNLSGSYTIGGGGGGGGTPSCKALYDFEAENQDELSLREGQIVTLLEKVDNEWFRGQVDGRIGYFPVNYVDVIVPLP